MSVIFLSKSIFWAQVRLLETRMYDGLRTEDTSNNEQLFLCVYGEDVLCLHGADVVITSWCVV